MDLLLKVETPKSQPYSIDKSWTYSSNFYPKESTLLH